ncbi:SubName: Full=Related to glycoside hydrolase family 23 protein-Laccaria bicolor {ECO:0000313/EMBL:CCA74381.1} [Serendipita indica DSM 11827]|jgi:hypothetical protein|uniref:Related to glycoside hydrolase family 23 protein-Laccaria bicolor n=1 Tax=Serendipita indica (strain DSM 11827) TaxID=1109443 RepID=G4TST8_SERID|nr:SubName: Full=Related to glycoside hydrolase family 23 protein-Laccaria bicolor {ECO:0000313/EMBL:CCA74381.1} [Serendipita indica DSM 11827]CCA74381.1 related to glycoside hydrolase family 23 protein-Laccaria bicolor [Serendipita indica DSM 11827]
MQLTFTNIVAVFALVATAVSASSEHINPGHKRMARRISRKALAARHHPHSHVTVYQTITSDPATSTTRPTVVTEYVTFTTTPADSASSTDAPSTTETPSSTESPSETVTESSSSSSASQPANSAGPVIQATGSPCGDPNATPDPAPTSGPNGSENWLNCGVDGDGWIPPPVTLQNIVYKDLATVLQKPGNVFEACAPYLNIFQSLADETGIPTILLASIALQESGCRPGVTGGAGEIGMMQITSEKCPTDGSNCYDPATNIGIGARYMKSRIDANDGNVAAGMGEYNGWRRGLTVAAANNYAICAQHNNLDYLHRVFNGYIQGIDPHTLNMGIYFNTC